MGNTQADYHVLMDKTLHSNIVDVLSFRGAECDTEHYRWLRKLERDCQKVNEQSRSSI
jgi:hypothetical protein